MKIAIAALTLAFPLSALAAENQAVAANECKTVVAEDAAKDIPALRSESAELQGSIKDGVLQSPEIKARSEAEAAAAQECKATESTDGGSAFQQLVEQCPWCFPQPCGSIKVTGCSAVGIDYNTSGCGLVTQCAGSQTLADKICAGMVGKSTTIGCAQGGCTCKNQRTSTTTIGPIDMWITVRHPDNPRCVINVRAKWTVTTTNSIGSCSN